MLWVLFLSLSTWLVLSVVFLVVICCGDVSKTSSICYLGLEAATTEILQTPLWYCLVYFCSVVKCSQPGQSTRGWQRYQILHCGAQMIGDFILDIINAH